MGESRIVLACELDNTILFGDEEDRSLTELCCFVVRSLLNKHFV